MLDEAARAGRVEELPLEEAATEAAIYARLSAAYTAKMAASR